jgi:ubiquinone/menaquinone biosynthesis C-methylase UbiE
MEITGRSKATGSASTTSMNASPEMFDVQAGFFEQRAGLPDDCCQAVAKSVIEIGKAGRDDLIVEVGAGTGQVGHWFESSVRYVGFDFSARMLSEFRNRLDNDCGNRLLVQADANTSWPVATGAARVIFSSRAMHLFEQEHVARETFRVASPAGATLILGRVEREAESVRARMSREMNQRLRRHGFEGRRGERRNRKLFELCQLRGAVALDPVPVSSWRVAASPRQSLDSWRSLSSMGGIPVPATVRTEVLRELEDWAVEEFGGLDQQFETEETYVLSAIRRQRTHEV